MPASGPYSAQIQRAIAGLTSGNTPWTGSITPATTNTYDLGTSALTWRTGYFGTSVVVGGVTITNSSGLVTNFSGSLETGASSYVWSKQYVYVGPTAGTQGRIGWLADGSLDLRPAAGGDTGVFNVKTVRTSAGAFSTLPGTPVEGMRCAVTDSSTSTYGATVTGGGANHVPVYYNGTNWIVA